jgi:hypothetical protein
MNWTVFMQHTDPYYFSQTFHLFSLKYNILIKYIIWDRETIKCFSFVLFFKYCDTGITYYSISENYRVERSNISFRSILLFQYVFININLYYCSCNCICCSRNCIFIVFIVCGVSFVVCVVMWAVFCSSVVCYFEWYALFVRFVLL